MGHDIGGVSPVKSEFRLAHSTGIASAPTKPAMRDGDDSFVIGVVRLSNNGERYSYFNVREGGMNRALLVVAVPREPKRIR